ncbi:MAG: glycosyltransferase family 4 protein [Pseudomonadota bacterium]
MNLCFLIYHYFPHGGQQRDFLRIARECVARGHRVRVFTLRWEHRKPPTPSGEGIEVTLLPLRALTRHRLYQKFHNEVERHLGEQPADCVVGFTRMPGLDVYFGADNCYAEKVSRHRPALYRLTPRCRHFLRDERAVFGADGHTRILLLSEWQKQGYLRHYPDAASRIVLLPPGVDPGRRPGPDADQQRRHLRRSLGVSDTEYLLLQIGSGYRTKGVDRALQAVASLPAQLRDSTRYVLIGRDRTDRLARMAGRLGIGSRCLFCGPRDDVMPFLAAADMMLHPARTESAGYALLEGLINGLPVLTTGECGYATHVRQADAGQVCAVPFRQPELEERLRTMLSSSRDRQRWRENGLQYGREADLYGLTSVAADVIEQVAGMTT